MGTGASLQNNRCASIYLDLLRKIISGEFRSGERLPAERELAVTYDTNRNTLREALRRLEQSKLVTVRHGQGATVTDFRKTGTIELIGQFIKYTPNHQERLGAFVDLLMARRQLIEMAVTMAAVRAKKEDVATINALIAQQLEAFEKEDRSVLASGDIALIESLVNAAHSLTVRWIANTLLRVYEAFLEPAKELWVLEPSFPRYLKSLSRAIELGDARAASSATGKYYETVDTQLIQMLEKLGAQANPLRGRRS